MKKIIIFLLFLCLIFASACGESKNNTDNNETNIGDDQDNSQSDNQSDNQNGDQNNQNKIEGLSDSEYEMIVSDYASYFKVNKSGIVIKSFYGKYDDIYALFVESNELRYGEEILNYTIAGVPFSFPNLHEIELLIDHKFYNLSYAYQNDLVSPNVVVSIYNKFKNKQVVCSIDKLVINIEGMEKPLKLDTRFNALINNDTVSSLINKSLNNSNNYEVFLDKDCSKAIGDISFSERLEVYVKMKEVVLTKWDVILNKYKLESSVNQIMLVKHTTGSNCVVEYYNKVCGEWELVFSENGVLGANGIGKVKEGDKKTPTGDFGIGSAFGIEDDVKTSLDFIKVTSTIYACDEKSEYYNQIIDTSKVDHVCHGEEMFKYKTAYAYGLQIGYNLENVYPLGSAIFLHVKSGSSTAGCVAISKTNMKTVLNMASNTMRIVIDEK